MSERHSSFSDASVSQRFKAGMVDALLFSVTLSVAKAPFHLLSMKDPGFALNLILLAVYYVIPQMMMGQSIGKRLFDIKLVRNDSNDTAGFFRVILRETVGKYVSALVLCIGYLSIIFRDDHRAWHDLICGTRVVSLTQEQEQSSFIMMFLSSLGVVSILGVIGAYVLLFTTYPLKQFAKNLENINIQTEGIHGSLLKGFSVERISYLDKEQIVEINHFQLNYKNLYGAFENQKFEIENISADSIKMKLTRSSLIDILKPKRTVETPDKERRSNPFKIISLANLSFKKIEILSDVPELNFSLSEISARNFTLNENRSELAEFHVESPDINLRVSNLHIDHLLQGFDLQALGSIRPSFSKKMVKRIDFSGKIEGQGANLLKVNIAAFENKLRLYSTPQSKFVLMMKDFSPSEYLNTALPIQKIESVEIFERPEMILGALSLAGFADYGNVHFAFSPTGTDLAKAVGMRGNETFEMNMRGLRLLSLLGLAELPKVSLKSNRATNAEDHLSHFYFNKNFAVLNNDEKSFLNQQNLDLGNRTPATASH